MFNFYRFSKDSVSLDFLQYIKKVVENDECCDLFNPISKEIILPKSEDNNIVSPLLSQDAKKYWDRLIAERFVSHDYQLTEYTSRTQAALIANYFAYKLNIRNKWKIFQEHWGINNLSQELYKVKQRGGCIPKSDVIKEIFS